MIGKNKTATGLARMILTNEAAAILKVTPIRVRQLINEGRLRAEIWGGRYVLDRDEVEQFAKVDRPVGNPAWKKLRSRD